MNIHTTMLELERFQREQNPTEDSQFIATVVQNEEGAFGIDILDSYHQGISLVLEKDGSFAVYFVGG